MPWDAEQYRNLCQTAAAAFKQADAIDKSRLHAGTPEWNRWLALTDEAIQAMHEYVRYFEEEHPLGSGRRPK